MFKNWLRPVLILPVFATLFIFLTFDAVKNTESLIWSDMEGYYVYLPCTFIYHDFVKEAVRDTNYLRPFPGTTKIFSKYTCSVAILESPFFLSAHLLSVPLGYPSDGHSKIYSYGLMIAAVFYLLAGLWILWFTLRRFYGLAPSAISLLGLLFGTNLYYYSFFQPAMSHVFNFFYTAAIIGLTFRILEPLNDQKVKTRDFLLFGLVAGLLVLSRPVNIVILLFPLYKWGKQTPEKWRYLRQNYSVLLLAGLAALLAWAPQLIYWKYVTGNWFLYSYQEETFKYWKEPKLFRVLFDAWNGWILYSPIVLIPIVGLIRGRNTNKYSERIVMFILAVATYIFASWWAWWFGGAFGHRCYVDYLPLLAIPFAGVAERAFKQKWTSALFVVLCVLLCYYNLGLTYNYQAPWDGPEWTYERVWQEVKQIFTL